MPSYQLKTQTIYGGNNLGSKSKPKRIEICNECGKDVSQGSGLFTNRITDLNNKKYRIIMGKPFYEGDYICIECDMKIREYSI
jgi:hypothetical protein